MLKIAKKNNLHCKKFRLHTHKVRKDLIKLTLGILKPSCIENVTIESLMSMNEPVRVITYETKENNAFSKIIKYENFNSNNLDIF